MTQGTPGQGADDTQLRFAFERERERLWEAEWSRGAVAAVIRMRALADISGLLHTDALVALAAAVATMRASPVALEGPDARHA